jgi:hypothetical protein
MADVSARALQRLHGPVSSGTSAASFEDALISHRLAFAAERARREQRVLELDASGRVVGS